MPKACFLSKLAFLTLHFKGLADFGEAFFLLQELGKFLFFLFPGCKVGAPVLSA